MNWLASGGFNSESASLKVKVTSVPSVLVVTDEMAGAVWSTVEALLPAGMLVVESDSASFPITS